MTSVLLSHPHANEVSKRVAAALTGHGLTSFVTGAAWAQDSASSLVAGLLSARANNRVIPPGVPLRAAWGVEVASRVVGPAMARWGAPVSTYDALFWLHDAFVARARWPRDLTAVYGYEDGALHTFRAARARGVQCIYDMPAPHWRAVEEILARELTRLGMDQRHRHQEPQWKRDRKDEELGLATAVLVASEFTRQTLLAAGCGVPVTVIPYGFPVVDFPERTHAPQGPFTAIAVGSLSVRKGIPVLLEAWQKAALPNARLQLVGRMDLPPALLERYRGTFEHIPSMPRASLWNTYAAADVLVFPTLCDGFGLVVQEAMCVGVPIIGTPNSGTPECVLHGETGWVVPAGDVDSLAATLDAAASARHHTAEMGRRARVRAVGYPWSAAATRLRHAVQAVG